MDSSLSDATGQFLDLALLCMFIVMTIFEIVIFAKQVSEPIMPEQEDKTAVYVDYIDELPSTKNEFGVLKYNLTSKTGMDLLMSLVVTDRYTPYPKSIRIGNSPIVDLNASWMVSKFASIQQIWQSGGAFNLYGLRDKVINDLQFVYDPANGDYMRINFAN